MDGTASTVGDFLERNVIFFAVLSQVFIVTDAWFLFRRADSSARKVSEYYIFLGTSLIWLLYGFLRNVEEDKISYVIGVAGVILLIFMIYYYRLPNLDGRAECCPQDTIQMLISEDPCKTEIGAPIYIIVNSEGDFRGEEI